MMIKNFSTNWTFSAGPVLYLYSDLKIFKGNIGGAAGENFYFTFVLPRNEGLQIATGYCNNILRSPKYRFFI